MEKVLNSRRSFLRLSAATLATLAASRAFGADEAPAGEGAYAGLPMGCQSYTFRDRSFDKMLEAVSKDEHLKFVEIWPGHMSGMSPKEARKRAEDHGLTITGYGVVSFTKDHAKNRKEFETGKILGVKTLTCDPSPDSFDSLDKLTEEFGISASIHDHGPGNRWGKIDTIWNAVKDHSPRIGLCNDTGHFIRAGEDPLRACTVFGDRVLGMHLKDFKKLPDGKWDDCILGDGSLNVEGIVKWLLDHKFRGDLSLEYEGKKPVESAAESLRRVARAVKGAGA